MDPAFNPGADAVVECLALQADGKILVGGFFSTLAGQARNSLGRLNADGSVDTSFNPGAGGGVTSLVVQPDGKILVGGWFTSLAGTNRNYLGRLNPDGTPDTSFNPGADNFVNCLALQADGKILVGGWFTSLAGTNRNHLGRLNPDGSIDTTFNPGANDQVYSLAVQTDGSILAGGYFTSLAGTNRNYIGRLNSNGSVDTAFNPGAGGQVSSLAVQVDGKILVGGWFSSLAGINRNGVGRLNNTSAATQSLSYSSSRITWLRGGTSPEVWRATFEVSANGSTWNALAAPARISGGWRLSSVSLPNNYTIRARGFIEGAQYGGSSWFVETNIGRLAIDQQPLSRTNIAGTLASFTVRAGGGSAPSYQWRKGGINLTNGPNISGATAANLILSNVFGADIGAYSVVVNDSHTNLTSQVANLVVLDPYISAQPVSRTNNALTTAAFIVTADGQEPLTYAWLKNSIPLTDTANISGSHSNILTLSNVLGGDAGGYSAVVTDAAGSSTSLVATLTVVDPILTSQPVSQAANAGQSVVFSVGAVGSPLSYKWRQGGAPLDGSTNATLTLTNLQAANAGFYDVVISNAFGVVTSAVATLTVNCAAPDALNPPMTGQVDALAVQPDGKIMMGGQFSGGPFDPNPYNIGRLNLDGSLDLSFYNSANAAVLALAIDTNGASILGGAFTSVIGQGRNYLARFDSDGSFVWNFNPGANATVRCLALQADGRILVGGDFTTLAGQPRSRIGRLMPDGSLDMSFNPGVNGSVVSLAVQPDGRILVGGYFTSLGGQPRAAIGRLNPDGSLDPGFNPGQNGEVDALAVQPDGKIVAGGAFSAIGGSPRSNLARLNADGSLDPTFNPGADNSVDCLGLQVNGQIIVGGSFATLGGIPLTGLGRLNADGTPDLTFNPGAGSVAALAIQKDGAIIAGGAFSTLASQPRPGIGRLANTSPANETLSFDNSSVTWLRSGTGPEIWRATFELSTNGTTWTALGDGSRITGGWQLVGLVIPTNSIVRGRGFTVGGNWFVETVAGLPVFTSQPLSLTNTATTTATFSVSDYGGTPLSYQWLKNGVALADGGNVSGAHTTTLTLTNVLGADAAGYGVILSNATGSVTSQVAYLTVIDPLLTSQPGNQTTNAGKFVSFSITVLGATPLHFQWRQNGTNLNDGGNVSGSQTSTLNLTNVSGFNVGSYQVIVSNTWGSVTSLTANLSVVDPVITTNPASQSVQAGQTVVFSVAGAGAPPLAYQWYKNSVLLTDATNTFLTLTNVGAADAASYTAVISDAFGSLTSAVAALTVNLSSPDSFNPGAAIVSALAVQPDGKVLAGSAASPQALRNPARFNPDGTVDLGFSPGITPSSIASLAVQPDGNIVVAGSASVGGGQQLRWLLNVWRLNRDGSMDTIFTNNSNPIFGGTIISLAVQPDGKILFCGSFSIGKPALTTDIARFNADGTLDTNFSAAANGTVNCVALQPDGAILVGGSFTTLDGQAHTRLGRFNGDGTLDTNFNPVVNSTVNCLAVQPDGKVLAGGSFSSLDGQTVSYTGRLNRDGTLDATFNPNVNGVVYSLALQTDGRILLAGTFSTIGGLARFDIGRLNADGSADLTFNPGGGGSVYALALQGDGAILAGGSFATLGGLSRTNIGRLFNTVPATQNLSFDGSAISWQRGGASPEVWRTTFDISTNGVDWISLGAGQRVPGGWQLTNLPLAQVRNIRARGFVTSGEYNGSSSFVETIGGPAVVVTSPASRTNNAGTTATFFAAGGGTPPLTCQWLKDGVPLTDAGNISGAGTPTLTLSNVLGGDAGRYALMVSNAGGSITSSVATLSVIEPIISLQPTNQFADAGQSANFTVAAIGSAPFTYQWRKNGTNISAPNSPTLTLAGVSGADLGTYSVLVSTPYGSAVSSNATLTINFAVPDSLSVNASGQVRAIVVQPDGKILIGGSFTNLAGQPRNFIARLKPDGSLDPDFNPGADNIVNCFAVQPDSKILVGGYFQNLSGQIRTCIARLCPDGSLDTNFAPSINLGGTPFVNALVVQPDGQILVGGLLGLVNGQFIPNLGRLNPDGSVDNTFSCSLNDGYYGVLALALQSDGRIWAGGNFCNGWCYLDRLNTNGSIDTTFSPVVGGGAIDAILLQPDGRIILGGEFTWLNTTRDHLARLNPDGTLDGTFNPGADGKVYSLALQADGKILVGGSFTTLAGQARTNLGRLNPDGSVDTAFFPSASSNVLALALQPDGAVLVGGSFSNVSGQSRSGLARLTPTDPGGQYLSSDGQSVTWLRAGTTPEVWRTTFEISTDGTNWSSLGAGNRITGGWGLSGLSLPANSWIRARGFTTGGYYTSSGWFVESVARVLAPPVILVNNPSFGVHSNQFDFNVSAVPGQVLVIETSTDLANWVPIQTNLVTSLALVMFADSQAGLFPHRFYRVRLYQGPLPPPGIGGNPGFQSGSFGFNIGGVAGQSVMVETSTNLLTWTALSTNTLTTEPWYFSDSAPTTSPQRFYRIRVQ
ncbi:MAG: immunoglobulin domain-containing protein [Verrucomicrobiota bacterium]